MTGFDAQASYKAVLQHVSTGMAGLGFKRRGNILRRTIDGNTQLIEFQKSQNSSEKLVRFTVNIALICGILVDDTDILDKGKSYDGHLRITIGELLPTPADLWWDITPGVEVEGLIDDILKMIREQAVPYLETYASDRDLLLLWTSGRSPGLTDGQRLRNLQVLQQRLEAR